MEAQATKNSVSTEKEKKKRFSASSQITLAMIRFQCEKLGQRVWVR